MNLLIIGLLIAILIVVVQMLRLQTRLGAAGFGTLVQALDRIEAKLNGKAGAHQGGTGKDGFASVAYMDQIHIGTGHHGNRAYDISYIEMTGSLWQCTDANFKSLSGLKTYAGVHIGVVGDDTFVPSELEGLCIGDLSVLVETTEPLPYLSHHVRATLRLAVEKDVFEWLLRFHEYPILIEPVFYRKSGQEKKKVVKTVDGLVSYVERVYFSPLLPEREQ